MTDLVLFVAALVTGLLIVVLTVGVDSPDEKRKIKSLIGIMVFLSSAYIVMDLYLF